MVSSCSLQQGAHTCASVLLYTVLRLPAVLLEKHPYGKSLDKSLVREEESAEEGGEGVQGLAIRLGDRRGTGWYTRVISADPWPHCSWSEGWSSFWGLLQWYTQDKTRTRKGCLNKGTSGYYDLQKGALHTFLVAYKILLLGVDRFLYKSLHCSFSLSPKIGWEEGRRAAWWVEWEGEWWAQKFSATHRW